MALSQGLYQKQLQKLSPQQIQLMKLLQVPTAMLEERIKDPTKRWKYNENDFKESKLWDNYMAMYEDCFEKCDKVPWIIVPSDQNWYKEFLIASKVCETLKNLNMQYPGIKK
jgi:polyphosphate kinase 2 (PPK2 family)